MTSKQHWRQPMTHADTIAADPAHTILACEAALARLEAAEAAMPEEPLAVKQYYLSYGETGDGEYYYDLCPEGCAALARFETQEHADSIAATCNDAPGSLQFRRDM